MVNNIVPFYRLPDLDAADYWLMQAAIAEYDLEQLAFEIWEEEG